MKIARKLLGGVLLIGLLFWAVEAAADLTNLAAAVHYTPPTNCYHSIEGDRSDPGDDPFSMNGPELLQYKDKNDRCGLISFRLGLAGAYVGEGKMLEFLPVEPASLKEQIKNEYKGKLPKISPATITKINESTAVSLTATRPPGSNAPYFLHFCWIQIETNIVLKVTAIACEAETFKALTNSMSSIKIDKPQLLNAFKPKREADMPRARQ